MSWIVRILGALGLIVVAWALVTAFPAVVHGHPAYAVLLLLTVVGCVAALWRQRQPRPRATGWRLAGSVLLAVGAVLWLAVVVYLRPYSAEEPALAAMRSDQRVRVDESATRIVLQPNGTPSSTGVLFQPGALVEARAYAAVLRPLAEAGHPVVIVKQPLAIAFLSLGALDSARADFPSVTSWVVGGHSLGGTVAAMQADDGDTGTTSPVRGLLLYASYPSGDISDTLTASVLSISGSNDRLATPADIEASRADLPADSSFTVVQGAVHAFFGDYGPQRDDGTPTISHDDARRQISGASVDFVAGVQAAAGS